MRTVTRGRELARPVLTRTAAAATAVADRLGRPATLAIVSATDPAARRFVDKKRQVLADTGVAVQVVWLDSEARTPQALEEINRLNASDEIDAVFLQFPLPENTAPEQLANALSIEKDIDCSGELAEAAFHGHGHPYVPVAPLAALALLEEELGSVSGRDITLYSKLDPFARVLRTLLQREQAVVTVATPAVSPSQQSFADADVLIVGESTPPRAALGSITSLNLLLDTGYYLGPRPDGWIPTELRDRIGTLMTQYGNIGPLTVAHLAEFTVKAASLGTRQ